MKNNKANPVVITEGDYQLIKNLIGTTTGSTEMTLAYELNRAIIVKKDAFPPHAIGLNSKVLILNIETKKEKSFTIVMPGMADIAQDKVSILSPMGTALLGFRKGEEVEWEMPKGLKKFQILDVNNEAQAV